jgi:hypothetical protein
MTEQRQEETLKTLDAAIVGVTASCNRLKDMGDLPVEIGALIHRAQFDLAEVIGDLRRARVRIYES